MTENNWLRCLNLRLHNCHIKKHNKRHGSDLQRSSTVFNRQSELWPHIVSAHYFRVSTIVTYAILFVLLFPISFCWLDWFTAIDIVTHLNWIHEFNNLAEQKQTRSMSTCALSYNRVRSLRSIFFFRKYYLHHVKH